jgi:hypothetical protein
VSPVQTDLAEAEGHADRLVAALAAEGFPARRWSKPSIGARVYVRNHYLCVSRGGDIAMVQRSRLTFDRSAFHPPERVRLDRALAAYRAATTALHEAEAARLDALGDK